MENKSLVTVQGEGAPAAAPAVVRMAVVVTRVPPASQCALEHSWMATPRAAEEVPETCRGQYGPWARGSGFVRVTIQWHAGQDAGSNWLAGLLGWR